jgi:hypothetical protein
MGAIEFIRLNTGERTTIEADGTMIKDTIEPPMLEWCDKCESWRDKLFGSLQKVNGESIAWFCLDCK